MQFDSRVIPIELLHTFVCVADSKSVTKAAKLLNITQPAVSLRIKRISAMLGEELFVWKNGNFSLTNHGGVFYPLARRVVDNYFDVMSEYERTLRS
jgi:DNA-binding transcriptional LysR family regulator